MITSSSGYRLQVLCGWLEGAGVGFGRSYSAVHCASIPSNQPVHTPPSLVATATITSFSLIFPCGGSSGVMNCRLHKFPYVFGICGIVVLKSCSLEVLESWRDLHPFRALPLRGGAVLQTPDLLGLTYLGVQVRPLWLGPLLLHLFIAVYQITASYSHSVHNSYSFNLCLSLGAFLSVVLAVTITFSSVVRDVTYFFYLTPVLSYVV